MAMGRAGALQAELRRFKQGQTGAAFASSLARAE